jgi:two-component system chemotaxis response regulator CheY
VGRIGGGAVDLLITDLNLPDVDGIAFIRRIRERGWQRPVIVISDYGLEAVTELREMLHVAAVLAKPFEVPSLVACIVTALNGHHNATNGDAMNETSDSASG